MRLILETWRYKYFLSRKYIWKCQPFFSGLNVLTHCGLSTSYGVVLLDRHQAIARTNENCQQDFEEHICMKLQSTHWPLKSCSCNRKLLFLRHWCRVTHICISKLTIIGSDNGLSPGQHQAITWTNARILLIGPLGTNFSGILIEIHIYSFKKIHFKLLAGNWQPFFISLNVLNSYQG